MRFWDSSPGHFHGLQFWAQHSRPSVGQRLRAGGPIQGMARGRSGPQLSSGYIAQKWQVTGACARAHAPTEHALWAATPGAMAGESATRMYFCKRREIRVIKSHESMPQHVTTREACCPASAPMPCHSGSPATQACTHCVRGMPSSAACHPHTLSLSLPPTFLEVASLCATAGA